MACLNEAGYYGNFTVRFECGRRLLWVIDTPNTIDQAIAAAEETLNVYRTTHVGMTAMIIEHKVLKVLS